MLFTKLYSENASPLLQRLRNSSVESSMPSSTSNSAISSTSMPSRIFTFTVFLAGLPVQIMSTIWAISMLRLNI